VEVMASLNVCLNALTVSFIDLHLQEFESTLEEVVNAKRLSASKMARLTEIAMKALQV